MRIGTAMALLLLTAAAACSETNGDAAGGGAGGDATGGNGGSGEAWSFDACEGSGRCAGDAGTCRDNPCFQAACGVCACGAPDCICDGFCECEPSTVGGTCVPEDFGVACAGYGDTAACEGDARCRWAVSGCGEAREVTGCFPKQDCASGWCGAGGSCVYVALDGCVGSFLCL